MALASFLISHGLVTDGVKELLTGNEITDEEKDRFISQLLSKRQNRIAYEIWLTRREIADATVSKDDMIFDGSFENTLRSDDNGFGWRFEKKLSVTAVSIDTTRSNTGTRSVNIKFKGHVETGTRIVSQLVPVKPNKAYRLTFAAKSEELVSGGLPIVTITAGHEPRASSPTIEATGSDWTVINVDFGSRDEDTVLIALERASCGSNPCPIFGSLWLDDFSLSESVDALTVRSR
jgi:hypothetical protein